VTAIVLDGTGEDALRSLFKGLKIWDRAQFQPDPMENEEISSGRFRLDLRRPELRRDGQLVQIHRRALGILCALATAKGEVVGKDDLMARLWPGRIVEEGNIHVHVSALRKALDEHGDGHSYVVTVPGRGYRLAGLAGSPEAAPRAAQGLPLPDKPSIAVMPFANLSGEVEQEFFAEGMVEDITTALSKLRWFFVIARNSAFTYKGRAVDVKTIGHELGVRYVLEGSVRRGGTRLRVTVQLIDAQMGNHVWAAHYDRDLVDIFEIQDEITERVVAAIEPELYAAEHIRSQRKTPGSLDAWECVISALSCIGQGTRAGDLEAEALCRRAIALNPDYGQAHSLLAWALLRLTYWSEGLMAVLAEVTTEVQTAFRLDDRDPWAHLAQANLLMRAQHYSESVRAFRRALELNPNFALAHAFIGTPLNLQGAHDDAMRGAQHALRLSPNDRLVAAYAGRVMTNAHFRTQNYTECIVWARKIIERAPEDIWGRTWLTASLALLGDTVAAAEEQIILRRLQPKYSFAWLDQLSPTTGEARERLRDGLRRAGVPEE
jgi:TolB-like protein/Flp pilus assembly protein TadD